MVRVHTPELGRALSGLCEARMDDRLCLLGELADPLGSDPRDSWFDPREGSIRSLSPTGRGVRFKPGSVSVQIRQGAQTYGHSSTG